MMPAETAAAWQQARLALNAYAGLEDARMEWLAHTHHAVFSVTLPDARYVLRLYQPARATWDWRQWLDSEMALLEAIHAASDLRLPVPIRTRAGQYIAALPQPAGGDQYAALLRYLEGTTRTPAQFTPGEAARVGAFMARLHTTTSAIHPRLTRSFSRPRLDLAGLLGEQGLYALADPTAHFLPDELATLAALYAQARPICAAIGEQAPHFGLIHGDLLLKNLLFMGEDVGALDFEYCGFGPRLYDLAPLLWQLKPAANYAAYADALWEGYSALRPLPARAHLETLIAVRHAASMRWIAANHDHPYVAGRSRLILAQRAAELRGFLATGRLQRAPS